MLSTAQPVCLHCYRFFQLLTIAVAVILNCVPQAQGLEIYAASIFSPDALDPDPSLSGILKIDLATGDVIPFVPESADFDSPTDVAVHPTSGDVYVSTLNGSIMRFDNTGTPLATTVVGEPAGTFASLDQSLTPGNFYSTLSFDGNGTLNAGTLYGEVINYDTSSANAIGYANINAPTFQSFDSVTGIDRSPTGELIVMAGGDFQAGTSFGSLYELNAGTFTEIVSPTNPVAVRGSSNVMILNAAGDYDSNGIVEAADYDVWTLSYGTLDANADGNDDGVVDAADYTVWRDNLGEESQIFVADLHDNTIKSYYLDGSGGSVFATIPPDIPAMLPPSANPLHPSNSPSEILLSPNGTLIVSLLGLTQRPDNRGAILEYDLEGNYLQTYFVDTNSGALPPISGIAFVPTLIITPMSMAVPEPTSVMLLVCVVGIAAMKRRD